MDLKVTLLTLIYMGTLTSCSDVSEKNETAHVVCNKVPHFSIRVDEKNNTAVSNEVASLEKKNKKIALENSFQEENLKSQYSNLRSELQKIKWEKEILAEKFELEKIKDEKIHYLEEQKQKSSLARLTYQANLSEAKAREVASKLALEQSFLDFNKSKLNGEIALMESKKKRDAFLAPEVAYLDNPLLENNKTIVISDRRVDLNGPITYELSEMISSRINYLNNKDSKKPIFLVIDSSPGGSIMAGNIIIRSMKSSKAPVYVVLKSFAASMAAVIVTLADNSFAYPQAVMLHHQPSSFSFFSRSNLTEQKEKYEELAKWWNTFGTPIAKKMGITPDEFIKLMYEHSSHGDWEEFATEAYALKWVDHIIYHIQEKSIRVDPLYVKEEKLKEGEKVALYENSTKTKELNSNLLPRLRPMDAYFLYNPDGYYRLQ